MTVFTVSREEGRRRVRFCPQRQFRHRSFQPLERDSFIQGSEERDHDDDGFVALFDGVSLDGWHAAPRVYGSEYPGGSSVLELFDRLGVARPVDPEKHPARWRIEDSVIVGEQDAPGSGYGLGDRGHIALELHDNDAIFGDARWGVGAQCRWQNIRTKEFRSADAGVER
jgi:hypothetical protein